MCQAADIITSICICLLFHTFLLQILLQNRLQGTKTNMAGKIRHLLERGGRYYARLSVPAALREIVGKRELTECLSREFLNRMSQL